MTSPEVLVNQVWSYGGRDGSLIGRAGVSVNFEKISLAQPPLGISDSRPDAPRGAFMRHFRARNQRFSARNQWSSGSITAPGNSQENPKTVEFDENPSMRHM